MKSESLVDVYISMIQVVGEFTAHRIMFAAGEKIGKSKSCFPLLTMKS